MERRCGRQATVRKLPQPKATIPHASKKEEKKFPLLSKYYRTYGGKRRTLDSALNDLFDRTYSCPAGGKKSGKTRTIDSSMNDLFERTYSCPAGVKPRTMDSSLNDLYEKRGSTREIALSSLIEGFTSNCDRSFAEKNFATLLYRFLNSFKKGSTKESCLATQALGLLAINIGCGDNAHELYVESLPPLSKALKSESDSLKLTSILDCLAIITFVGGTDAVDTERSMQIIWRFIHSEAASNVVGTKKHLPAVQAAAIYAWSFLLTTMDGWKLNFHYWQGAVYFFLGLLEAEDESVCVAAGEALALIFEVGCLEKFASTNGSCSSTQRGNALLDELSSVQDLKEDMSVKDLRENIVCIVRNLSLQAKSEKVHSKALRKMYNSTLDIFKILEKGYFPETSTKIGKQSLKLHTWSQLLQLNFLKCVLGGGFTQHMLENELLYDVFDFKPRRQSDNGVYVSEREEVLVRYFVPELRKEDSDWRLFKSSNSNFCKARTQLLNKQRVLRGEELGLSCDE